MPAVFGMEGALSALPSGEVVTVDATAGRIYRGRVEPLPEAERPQTQLAETTGPVRDAFCSISCPRGPAEPLGSRLAPSFALRVPLRSHDVVRFIHEKALAEMLSLPDSTSGGPGGGLQIRERLPFDLRLVPLGPGVKMPRRRFSSIPDQVTSSPCPGSDGGASRTPR